MGVRVWGAVGDRLVEVVAEPGAAFGIAGLPEDRVHTTRDRVRAALVNTATVPEAPSVSVRLHPALRTRGTSPLDLPIALAALAAAGVISSTSGWIFATGRLGLDGSIHAPGVDRRLFLAQSVRECQRASLESERMFEKESR